MCLSIIPQRYPRQKLSNLTTTLWQRRFEYNKASDKIYTLSVRKAEEAYYASEGKYFPENGVINIPSGVETSIPELGFSFKRNHKHHFYVYGYNVNSGSTKYNIFYIIVYADYDYNVNGSKDVLCYISYIKNDEVIYDRQFYQLL